MNDYFPVVELVSPEIIKVIGEKAALKLVHVNIRAGLNLLREDLGIPLYINGMYKGRRFKYSGVRSLGCKIGASRSRHKPIYDDQAFDLKCTDMDKLWGLVKEGYKKYGIRRVEARKHTPGWMHAEFSFTPVNGKLVVFKPK